MSINLVIFFILFSKLVSLPMFFFWPFVVFCECQ